MFNDAYEPTGPNEESVITTLREGGRMSPRRISDETGIAHPYDHLRSLTAAGWVVQPEPGLYEFTCDPRDLTDGQIADAYRAYANDLDPK